MWINLVELTPLMNIFGAVPTAIKLINIRGNHNHKNISILLPMLPMPPIVDAYAVASKKPV
jgi:hypothetical protein